MPSRELNMKIKRMVYTKDSGEVSKRRVVVVSEPRENYLTYDISDFSDNHVEMFQHYLESIEAYREETLKEFEDITKIKVSSLWRSFKPGGIEWIEDSD